MHHEENVNTINPHYISVSKTHLLNHAEFISVTCKPEKIPDIFCNIILILKK